MALCLMAPVMARISLPAYNAEALVYLSCPVRGGRGCISGQVSAAPRLDYLDLAFLPPHTHIVFLVPKCTIMYLAVETKAVQKCATTNNLTQKVALHKVVKLFKSYKMCHKFVKCWNSSFFLTCSYFVSSFLWE